MERNSPSRRAKRIVICASGAYLSYSLPGLVLQMLRHVADDVQVVLSPSAARIVSRYAVEIASRHHVFVHMDERADGIYVPHIELGRDIDFVLVYPASVSTIGKVAHGICDELIPALILATTAPVIFVPIANPAMIQHPAFHRNVRQLEEDGYVVTPPLAGPEIATREGLDEMNDPFPIPSLLLQLQSLVGSNRGVARRPTN